MSYPRLDELTDLPRRNALAIQHSVMSTDYEEAAELASRKRMAGTGKKQSESPALAVIDEYPKGEEQGAAVGLMRGAPVIRETHTRSLVKGLTWRIVATSTTTISESSVCLCLGMRCAGVPGCVFIGFVSSHCVSQSTCKTLPVAWIVTGKVDTALQIGFFEFFAKLFIYYAHERLWTYIRL